MKISWSCYNLMVFNFREGSLTFLGESRGRLNPRMKNLSFCQRSRRAGKAIHCNHQCHRVIINKPLWPSSCLYHHAGGLRLEQQYMSVYLGTGSSGPVAIGLNVECIMWQTEALLRWWLELCLFWAGTPAVALDVSQLAALCCNALITLPTNEGGRQERIDEQRGAH